MVSTVDGPEFLQKVKTTFLICAGVSAKFLLLPQ
jgi:hypothetical protein